MHIPTIGDFGPVDSLGWRFWEWAVEYVDPDANSNKFYRVVIGWNEMAQDGRILYEWGRIGTAGQCRLDLDTNLQRLIRLGQHKMNQKIAKGYTVTKEGGMTLRFPSSDYDRLGINVRAIHLVQNLDAEKEKIPTLNDVATAVEKAMQLATADDSVDMVTAAITSAEMKSGIQTLQDKLNELKAQAEFADIAMHAKT